MDEYIHRGDTVDTINANADNLEQNGGIPYAQGARAMAIVVEQMPSVDVVQIVHGRWMPQKGGGLCCSECGRYALDEPDGNFIHVSVPSKFCPHCGAKMDAYGEG